MSNSLKSTQQPLGGMSRIIHERILGDGTISLVSYLLDTPTARQKGLEEGTKELVIEFKEQEGHIWRTDPRASWYLDETVIQSCYFDIQSLEGFLAIDRDFSNFAAAYAQTPPVPVSSTYS